MALADMRAGSVAKSRTSGSDPMGTCEICGNRYDKAFTLTTAGRVSFAP